MNNLPFVWAFDIGTTSLKAMAIASDGKALAKAFTDYELLPSTDGRIEFPTERWEEALRSCTSQLIRAGSSAPEAMVVGGQGPTLVPVGRDGVAVDHAISWMDRRAIAESAEIEQQTGRRIDSSFYMPKALWYARHGAHREAVTCYAPCPEYLVSRLTGRLVSALPDPGFAWLVWNREAMSALGLPATCWPEFVPCGQLIGKVTSTGADRYGIPAGLPVIVGPPDFVESWLGTATVRPGRACDRGGTSQGVNLCIDHPQNDSQLLTLPHIIQGYWNISGIVSTSGKTLEKLRDLVGWVNVPYEQVIERALQTPAGAAGLIFLPYLAGERAPIWNADARGVLFGLTLSHDPAHLVRAGMESVGYAIRHILECFLKLGLEVSEFRSTGKQAYSYGWTQIKADITGRPFRIPQIKESEPLGGAVLAGVTLGWYSDLVTAAETMVRMERLVEPDRTKKERYEQGFQLYRTLAETLKDRFAELKRYRQL